MNKKFIIVFLSLLCVGVSSKAVEGANDGSVGIYQNTPKLNTANANPLLDFVYCADPTAIVHDGRVYVYGSNDQQQCDSVGIEVKDNSYEYIHSLVMISSDDMVNWTYHGVIDVEKVAPWTGKKGVSWAPSIVSRLESDGKTHFYLYYAHGGGGVAMLTSTSPVGPWTDPLGRDIVYFGMSGLENCPAPFDPGAVIDEHGQGWLSFGGGTASYGTDYMPGSARIVRLGDDMKSVVGDIVEIPAPYFFEASELNYINDTYIYSYSTNWLERNGWPYSTIEKPTTCCIGYMTSKTPLIKNSWEYSGNILKNPGEYDGMNWANNHTHFLQFKDSYYMFYHNRILEEARGINPGFRSICVDKIDLDEANATISLGTMTRRGPAQIKKVNPFEWQSAATTAATYGIKYIEGAESGKMILRADGNGQCFEVRGVDCANSSKTVGFRVKGKGEITIRKNGMDGEVVATVRFESNDWKVISTNLASTLTGVQNLCFVFGKGEVLLDEWKFSPDEKKIFSNPVIFADVPDVDVIRVDDNFYMISTTMHLMPGAPIMRSKDLVNWEIISYLYDEIKDSPFYDLEGGHVYSAGQWASSLRYHHGKYYAFFATNKPSKSYIYTATDPAGKWEKTSVMNQFHDASLLFDDDGRVYLAHSAGNIKITELKSDLSGVKEDGLDITAIHGAQHGYKGLLEGTHIYKINKKYYMLLIWWPKDGIRTQLCFRSDRIEGPYESKIILSDTIDNPRRGVAQGSIVDTKNSEWYGFLFQDFGAVGRTPVLMPCRWEDGWPMLGDENGKVKKWLEKPIQGYSEKPLVISDDFTSTKLALNWQWNHNPDNNLWSLTERPGYMRLRTGKVVQNIFEARNTLSQRTEGPLCSGIISIDISCMKDGDITGLGAYNGEPGLISVVKEKKKRYIVMTDRGQEMKRVELKKNNVHLRMDCDFNINVDKTRFYYSLDGKEWIQLGSEFQMIYYTNHFMGIRFAIYNYATKHSGGYVDVDFFTYGKEPLQQTPLNPGSSY